MRSNGIRDLGLDFKPTKAEPGTIFQDVQGRLFEVEGAGTRYYQMKALNGGHSGLYRIERSGYPDGMYPVAPRQQQEVESEEQ